MINKFKHKALLILFTLLSVGSFAQEIAKEEPVSSGPITGTPSQPPVDMATGLYQSGKIYVVVIVLSIIMVGILGYLIMLDRKVGKLEKEMKNK